ncbi:ABC transporter ATP-binding protein [Blastopirellula marina]|uniref:ABC transporter ATP-binding protein n=1 Tax=Blastopirellula marina TaxID=124 RepID=A0A2S8FP24_9BACT|nr:ABC transporter ATP-binding protein [Blastopirellula marina]PQO33921.1 ABC transporter ATP-binding protein [Blastopirellula marina]PTL43707.1 ABC transporter ATP-binding protein [Blastopirellula marina]
MLHLENVKKSFRLPSGDRMPILDVPHFDVAAAEQMVIVGRSGCGKSTLLHLIAGIGTPDSGVISINGLDISRLSEDGRDRFRAEIMGYVFQTFNLLQGFTALENVILGMSFSKGRVDRDRAHDLLERVGLGHRLHSYPRTMSVGEQQRVAVARALANRPKLLLADEPTANVDPANQQSIVDLIRQTCQEEEISLVMVTHAMEVAEQFQRVEPLEKLNLLAQAKKAHA